LLSGDRIVFPCKLAILGGYCATGEDTAAPPGRRDYLPLDGQPPPRYSLAARRTRPVMTSRDPDDPTCERITAVDLGLAPDARIPLRFTPGQHWSPLVVSLPHVGLAWPHDLRPKPQANFARNADYAVDTLYRNIAELGVASVSAVFSRLVVDLNRAEDDVARTLVPDHPAPRPRRSPGVPSSAHPTAHEPERPGRGVVWAHAVGNVRIISGPLRYADFQRRIDRYHTPYYRAVETLLERRRARFGFAILLDAHSMPSSVGVDLVAGTLDGASCHPEIARRALAALRTTAPGRAPRIGVRRDDPYRGGEIVRRFGRPRDGLHALQLEVSRALYMDETSLQLYARDDTAGSNADTSLGTEDGAVRATSPSPADPTFKASAEAPMATTLQTPTSATTTATTPASKRQARGLAELQRRVTCLVAALAGVTHEDLGLDLEGTELVGQ